MLKDKILKHWLNSININWFQRLMLRKPRIWLDYKVSNKKYEKLEQRYFDNMQGSKISIKDHDIMFEDSATKLINALFEEYVDEKTLVIASTHEHPSVTKNLEKCSSVFYIDVFGSFRNFKSEELEEAISKYNKIFVYMVGTHVSNGKDTDFKYFKLIKKFADNKKCIYVLDDVQAMFLKHKDYSLFDYIIGTGHALIPRHNLGMIIIKKNNKMFGKKMYFKGLKYIKRAELLLRTQISFQTFYSVMADYYKPLMRYNKKYKIDGNPKTPYLFHILKKKGTFDQKDRDFLYKKYKVDIDALQSIRFRASVFITKPKSLIKAIKAVNKVLD